MEEVKEVKKRVRDESDSESGIDYPEVKRLREDLLDCLDDNPEFCTSNQDLDLVMKSFEQEITASPSSSAVCGRDTGVVDLVSELGESRLDLGYLLGASDDELGITPPLASPVGVENVLMAELVPVEANSFGGDFWDLPGQDSFGLGLGEADSYNGEYVALDGLFDYWVLGNGSGDISWRPESLPAQ